MQYEELIEIVTSRLDRPRGAKHFTGPPALDDNDERVRWMLEDPESLSDLQLSVLIEDGNYPVSVYYAAYALNLEKHYELFGDDLINSTILIWVGSCREEMIRDGVNDAILKRIEFLFFEGLESSEVGGEIRQGYDGKVLWYIGVDSSEVFSFFNLIDLDPVYGTPYAYVDGIKLADRILERWLNDLKLNANCSAFLLNVIYGAAFCLDKEDLYNDSHVDYYEYFKGLANYDDFIRRHWEKGGELLRACGDMVRFENMKQVFGDCK